jgi:hypothetical protein
MRSLIQQFTPTLILAIVFISVCGIAHIALAKVGVGMGAGEVRVTEPIKPGGIYSLPSLRIFNTGDETTTYGMNVAYHQDNPERRPGKTWFTFNPSTFTIAPGDSQEVSIAMFVPVKTEPGEYFAFVESGPVASGETGTSVGVAVATKLYFTVVHANIWEAMTYRMSSFFNTYAPWSWIVFGTILSVIILVLLSRFFSFNISVKQKKEGE